MTRYLVLEVVDDVHDLTDLIETMRRHQGTDPGLLQAGGYALEVYIPARPLVQKLDTTGGPLKTIYVEEA